MGKTKTAFVKGVEGTADVSGKEAYEAKRKKKAAVASALASQGKAQVEGLGLKGGERIKVIGGEAPEEPPVEKTIEGAEKTEATEKKSGRERIRGKNYLKARAKIDKNKAYPLEAALKLVRETSYSKFDGTMEMHISVKRLGLTAKVSLPHFSGKEKIVELADDKTVEKLTKGKIDFDVLLATADMMPKLIPFAKVLGPRGLMPNPKNGTIIKNIKDAEAFKGNSLNLKTQKDQPLIHTAAGKLSQKDGDLLENLEAILDGIGRKNIVKAYIKSTMSPSVKVVV